MSGAVFHQGAAKIAAGQTPSLAEIGHPVMNVNVGSCEFGQIALETEHRGCFGPDLHQADLADAANRAWIVAALDRGDGVGDVRRQAVLRGFPFYERPVGLVRIWLVGVQGLLQSKRPRFSLRVVLGIIGRGIRSWYRQGRTARRRARLRDETRA